MFAALAAKFTVEGGFFYSTGSYHPFGHFAPYAHAAIGYPYSFPTAAHHHVLPTATAVTYSGCRNVNGSPVPCALPTPYVHTIAAPAVIAPVAAPEEAPAEEGAAAPEAASER